MIQSRNSTQEDELTDRAKGRGVARTSTNRTPTPTSREAGLNPQRACLQEVGPWSLCCC